MTVEANALPTPPKVMHLIVGHGLRGYFVNAVRSVRALAPNDFLLVIDNASPDEALRDELVAMADGDELLEVILRDDNDVELNGKVGSLYAAYGVAFDLAIGRGFDLVHVLQGDMQMLFWDDDVVAKAMELFAASPKCANVFTFALSKDQRFMDDLVASSIEGVFKLAKYGLTDTGIFHLGRWQSFAMAFDDDERKHAQRYLDEGFEVLVHPWPPEAQIPWPAVVRRGVQRGIEVTTREPFLLRPLSKEQVAAVKASSRPVWLEDVCIPWGWTCLTPMWTTDLNDIHYWVMRRRDAAKNGISALFPRFDTRGVERRPGMRFPWGIEYRPSLFELYVSCPAREVRRRARALVGARAGRAGVAAR